MCSSPIGICGVSSYMDYGSENGPDLNCWSALQMRTGFVPCSEKGHWFGSSMRCSIGLYYILHNKMNSVSSLTYVYSMLLEIVDIFNVLIAFYERKMEMETTFLK